MIILKQFSNSCIICGKYISKLFVNVACSLVQNLQKTSCKHIIVYQSLAEAVIGEELEPPEAVVEVKRGESELLVVGGDAVDELAEFAAAMAAAADIDPTRP